MPDGMDFSGALLNRVRLEQFGPARVTAVLRDTVEVTHAGETHLAKLAVSAFYQAHAGDTVLILGAEGETYVIGVLASAAPAALTVPGDLCIRAPNGTISLEAKSFELDADCICLRSNILSISAARLREAYDEVRRAVLGLADIDYGAFRATVRGLFDVSAKRARLRAEEEVAIDGKTVQLG